MPQPDAMPAFLVALINEEGLKRCELNALMCEEGEVSFVVDVTLKNGQRYVLEREVTLKMITKDLRVFDWTNGDAEEVFAQPKRRVFQPAVPEREPGDPSTLADS